MRHTKTRDNILYFLEKKYGAYTAYEISEKLCINPVTVYRVLDYLKDQKLVHHIPSLGKWSICQCLGKSEDHGFLICRKCDTIKEFLSPHQCFHHHGFHCEEHITEILGTCEKCSRT